MLGPARLGQLTAVLAALALAGCAELEAEPAEPAERTTVRVTKHTDGDTLWLSDIGKVRLIGVDTPEVYGGVECYGREASAFVERTVPLGSEVRYRLGVDERDRYGRALAYIWLPDGRFLNRLLVARGYAQPMTVPPNVEYEDVFVKAAAGAREAGRGLWGRPSCLVEKGRRCRKENRTRSGPDIDEHVNLATDHVGFQAIPACLPRLGLVLE